MRNLLSAHTPTNHGLFDGMAIVKTLIENEYDGWTYTLVKNDRNHLYQIQVRDEDSVLIHSL